MGFARLGVSTSESTFTVSGALCAVCSGTVWPLGSRAAGVPSSIYILICSCIVSGASGLRAIFSVIPSTFCSFAPSANTDIDSSFSFFAVPMTSLFLVSFIILPGLSLNGTAAPAL